MNLAELLVSTVASPGSVVAPGPGSAAVAVFREDQLIRQGCARWRGRVGADGHRLGDSSGYLVITVSGADHNLLVVS